MDDDELRRRPDVIEAGLTALNAALGEARNDLMALMDDQHERLINDHHWAAQRLHQYQRLPASGCRGQRPTVA
jgi:hypothetical protein